MATKKRKVRLQDLPGGLRQFLGTIETEDKYTAELLSSLKALPGADKTQLDQVIKDWKAMQAKVWIMEELTADARLKARTQAVVIFKACLEKWTIKQLEKATGYD